ncbi:hypothetical protein J5N97_017962 [Dioscorea zingiberensis]|uniref:Uncharacterized protein n=1 Tax=Dioscorea zingiberensis TaxID=325984 RepID=A0A9D5CN65_9LILI|nr:hypothetical protein J5N97_017962 [Dioscorea zingiberensis]
MKTELFNSFIGNHNLSEPKYIGSPFTWCNNQRGGARIWARLDRIIVNSKWYDVVNSYTIKHLPKCHSDHCPILLQCRTNTTRGKKPFRFENTWAQSQVCHNIVEETWNQPCSGNPMHTLNHKFCTLKNHLIKNCGKMNQGMGQQIKYLEDQIIEIEVQQSKQQGNFDLDIQLRSLYNKHQALIRQNTTFWAQRSR